MRRLLLVFSPQPVCGPAAILLSKSSWRLLQSVLLFLKYKCSFFGYFDPETIFVDNETTDFSG